MGYDEAFEAAIELARAADAFFPARCRCGRPLARARVTRLGVLLDAAEADEDLRTAQAAAGIAPVAEVPARPLQLLLEHPDSPALPDQMRLLCTRDRRARVVEGAKLLDAVRRGATIVAA